MNTSAEQAAQDLEDVGAVPNLFGQLRALRAIHPEPAAMFQIVLRAIPGQACPRHARDHVFEDGADEGPCVLQSAD
eukprot:839145-Pyramimonas_sp.AAC.1